VKLQHWIKHAGERVVLIFEGRDAAGKGGTIKRIVEPLNPRGATIVALVLPALCRAPAGRGRDRPLRPLLVQPRRRRAGDGFLHGRGRQVSLELRCRPVEDELPARVSASRQFCEQAGLADSRLAHQRERRRPPTIELGKRVVEDAARLCAPNEPLAYRDHFRSRRA
jgi:hypothetical protein